MMGEFLIYFQYQHVIHQETDSILINIHIAVKAEYPDFIANTVCILKKQLIQQQDIFYC